MSFQKTVRNRQGFGLVGDVRLDSPNRASAFILVDGQRDASTAPTTNIVGRACTYYTVAGDDSDYTYATVGGEGAFCGIITSSKQYVSRGALGVPLNADGEYDEDAQNPLYIPSGSIVELMTMGHITLQITNAALPGDFLCFSQKTGEIQAISRFSDDMPAPPDGFTMLKNASVDRYPQLNNDGGLILARFTY